MNKLATLSFAALLATLSASAWPADTDRIQATSTGRVERAHRQFGDVRFVMGSGQAMQWLEMYVGSNLIAAFREFDVQAVHASPDGQYFLALSNRAYSSMAYAVLDRAGHIVFSGSHYTGPLRYCEQPGEPNYHWIDADRPAARFEMGTSNATTPARRYLKWVTVRGCDGKTVVLGRGTQPIQQATKAADVDGQDRGSSAIGNTIANLRGMYPTLGTRTLKLTDGGRVALQRDNAAAATDAAAEPAADTQR